MINQFADHMQQSIIFTFAGFFESRLNLLLLLFTESIRRGHAHHTALRRI